MSYQKVLLWLKKALDNVETIHIPKPTDKIELLTDYSEEKKALTNTYKCPFCKKKFSNLVDGGNARDVREMVVHCGSEHGFALYYLMVDTHVEDMRELLVKYKIKEEPKDKSLKT